MALSSSSSSSSMESSSSSSMESSSSSSNLSSSSSSSSSLSSSSSSSTSNSSSSSTSHSSFSSRSSSSSSSSSSRDSSSSSSESVGNFSSSSSSSIELWNIVKAVTFGHSATTSGSVGNRLAQTVPVESSSISVEKVFCYLYGPYTSNSELFDINVGIYLTDTLGQPSTLIDVASISSLDISGNGWYEFDFSVSSVPVPNGYISIVLWQEWGNENNYVMWGYTDTLEITGTKAFISNDATSWTEIYNTIFGLKIIESTGTLFDLTEHYISTEQPEMKTFSTDLTAITAEYDGTILKSGPDKVEIDNDNLLISFVLDSSGSMGWNDRFSNRADFANVITNSLTNTYPKDVVFDVIRFGATQIDPSGFTQTGIPMRINLDARNPSRSPYVFTLSNVASVTAGDIYSHNGNNYVVIKSATLEESVVMNGNEDPLDSGILVKVSGSGDSDFTFSSFRKISVDNSQMIACGFKNFVNARTYNIGSIQVDSTDILLPSSPSWKMFYPDVESPSFSTGLNGPLGETTMDIGSTNSLNVRGTFSNYLEAFSNVSSNVASGSSSVIIANTATFVINQLVDLVDGDFSSYAHTITNIISNTSTIVIDPSAYYEIKDEASGNGIAINSSFFSLYNFNGTTIMLLVRDVAVEDGELITFYFQTTEGLSIEWDFNPHKQWYFYNFYWLDETAVFPIVVLDKNGKSLPDETEINMDVNTRSLSPSQEKQPVSQKITEDVSIGDSRIYVSLSSVFSVGQKVNIVDSLNLQPVEITGLDLNDSLYIDVTPSSLYQFSVNNGAIVVTESSGEKASGTEDSIADIPLSLINATTIYANTTLSPSELLPFDYPQISPSTSYEDLNFLKSGIRNKVSDIPSIGGKGVIRVLPITEDVIKSTSEKDEDLQRLMTMEPPTTYSSQSEQNEGDLNSITEASNTQTGIVTGEDYTIESPVFLLNGEAKSSMTSFATEFELYEFDGLTLPGIGSEATNSILTKKYTIYPSVIAKNSYGVPIKKQFFDSFDVFFTPRYYIMSKGDGQTVKQWCPEISEESGCSFLSGYNSVDVAGVHALSGKSYTIEYTVTDKFSKLSSGTLLVKIYSNTVINFESVACSDKQTTLKVNHKLDDKIEVVDENIIVTPQYSAIDTWRNDVNNNKFTNVINSTSEITSSSIQSEVASDLNPTESSDSSSTDYFYTNPQEWTKANQFSVSEFELTIENGTATLEIPSSDVPALLFVEASYPYDNGNSETIRGDFVYIANPLNTGGIEPMFLTTVDDQTVYELGSLITWMDGTNGLIEDGVSVEYSSKTITNPTTSVTENGVARGMYIGPHRVLFEDPASECGKREEEEISITIRSKTGYEYTCVRKVVWLPIRNEIFSNRFVFKVDGDAEGWADGGLDTVSTIITNLADPYNPEILGVVGGIMYWVGEDGILRLNGEGQDDNAPRKIVAGGFPVTPHSQEWIPSGPITFSSLPVNKNIGNSPPICIGSTASRSPWEEKVYLTTSYKDENGIFHYGEGSKDIPVLPVDSLSPNPQAEIFPPTLKFKEPLGVSISLEAKDGIFIRDGVHSPNVIADVTWRGNHLKKMFTFSPDANDLSKITEIDFPLPSATFNAGVCLKTNSTGGTCPNIIDARGDMDGCLVFESDKDINLSSYTAQVGLFRTDIFMEDVSNVASDTHTHECSVDDYTGNGSTVGDVIVLVGTVVNHSHIIANFVAEESESHTHNLRSVAITKLLPTTNVPIDIAINGYVPYDPTNCEPSPYDVSYYPYPEGCNRLMYGTLYIDGLATEPTVDVTLEFSDNVNTNPVLLSSGAMYFTSENPGDTSKGFDIVVSANTTSYFDGYVIVPEQPVPDGSRVTVEIETYKPKKEISSNGLEFIPTVGPDIINDYLILEIKATVSTDGYIGTKKGSVRIVSSLKWIPGVEAMLVEPTNVKALVTEGISSIGSIGASQIYDAVRLSAQRIIDYNISNSSSETYKKIIVLLSDGDENSSEYSINSSINMVSAINGYKQTPIFSFKVGSGYSADEIVMLKLANETGGFIKRARDMELSDLELMWDQVLISDDITFNKGTYTVTLESDKLSLPYNAYFSTGTYIPNNSKLQYRLRISADGVSWSDWSDWEDSEVTKSYIESIDNESKYFQYEVKFYGNENFESPTITQGLSWTYLDPKETIVFFNPISFNMNSFEYLSSALITHYGLIPPTSSVSYGITQSDSVDPDDYTMDGVEISPNRQEILLSRYNEPLTTKNYKTYTAVNGRWASSSVISIYKYTNTIENGELVDSSQYTVNNVLGTVSFLSSQDASNKYMICIDFNPSFRFICKIINKGTTVARIDHIGLIYNIMQRIPVSENGSIIHKTVDVRI